jgi:hypothetical protein
VAPPKFSALHYPGAPQLAQKPKSHQKINLKNRECEAYAKDGNGNKVNLLKTCLEKFIKKISGELIFGGF